MKFLRLTDHNSDRPVFLNISSIESVTESQDQVVEIRLLSGFSVWPKESYLDVTGQISNLTAH